MKRAIGLLGLSVLAAAGCIGFEPKEGFGFCGLTDMGDMAGTPPADQTVPSVSAKCAAAKGLGGDNLLCVDFDKVTALTDPALAGWNFNANMADCWQIASGALSVKNFATFTGNCGLTLPPIDLKQADKQKYQRVTLALVHRVDMSDPEQNAQVFLDLDLQTRLIHQSTSRAAISTLTTTILTVEKKDLPMTLNSVYKFFLKASSGTVNARQGWQILSIAANGSS